MNFVSFKDAKKVAQDKHSSTFRLRNGSELKIAHSGLSPEHLRSLGKLPLYAADGADVQAPDFSTDQPAGIIDAAKNYDASQTLPPRGPESQNTYTPAPTNDSPPQPVGSPLNPTTPTATDPGDYRGDLNQVFDAENQGAQAQMRYEQQIAKGASDVDAEDLKARQGLEANIQNNLATYTQHQQDFLNDFGSGKIDPNHYMASKSDVGKVSTAIGLALGGLSSGLTGQPNPALEFLNKQIDRDIASQQASLDNKKTILGAYQQLYGNSQLANNMTRVAMNDIYTDKMKQVADQNGSAKAQAAYQMWAGQKAQDNFQLKRQNAIYQGVTDALKTGGKGLTPTDLATAGLPGATQEQMTKEAGSIQAQKASLADGAQIYQQLQNDQTLKSRVLDPLQSSHDIDALNARLVNGVMSNDASKRLTPETARLEVLPYEVKFTDSPEEIARKSYGYSQLIKTHSAGSTPITDKYAPQLKAAYPSQPGELGAVPIQAPNGQVKLVPAAQVQQALASGGKKVQ